MCPTTHSSFISSIGSNSAIGGFVRVMRVLSYLFLIVFLGVPAAAVALAYLALGERPEIQGNWRPSAEDIDRARQVVRAHDPRSLPEGVTRRVSVTQRDINLAGNYALNFLGEGVFEAQLATNQLRVRGAVRVPDNPFGSYLNLSAMLASSAGEKLPKLTEFKLGELDIPPFVANQILFSGLSWAYSAYGGPLRFEAREVIESVSVSSSRLQVAYRLPQGMLASLREALVSRADRDRLQHYHAALVRELSEIKGRRASIIQLMPRMFELARQRSRNGDPMAENRALLMVLGTLGSGRGLGVLMPQASTWSPVPKVRLTLQGRRDFSQHFLASAALAVLGGSALADSIGLFKEVQDAAGGSGFSFTDLAADRAGTRFGEVAVASPASAKRVQAAMRRIRSEADIMPPVRDLPEGLSASEFSRRFGAVDSVAYRRMVEEIERRLDSIALYRQ